MTTHRAPPSRDASGTSSSETPTPPCVFVDPCGPYSVRLVEALGRRGGKAVAVFTTRARQGIWHYKWKEKLGEHFVAEYSTWDAESLEALAGEIREAWPRLEGLVPWDEDHMSVAIRLADLLDLGWNSAEIITRCRDKGVMKRWISEQAPEIRLNASRVVRDGYEALDFQEEVGTWPIVVKPTGGSGSADVHFAEGRGRLLGACQAVLESESGEVLLEEFVGGRELAVNGLVDGFGDLVLTDLWLYDRRESHGIPNLYYAASKVGTGEPDFRAIAPYAAAVVKALGVRRAPIHMEVKIDRKGPCLIEVGARFGGISLPLLASHLHGRDLFAAALKHYVGVERHDPSDVDLESYDRRAARVLIGIQDEELERIEEVHGVETVEALDSFFEFGYLRPVGSAAPLSEDLDGRAWEVLLVHEDPKRLASDARVVRRVLRYS